VDAEVVMAIDAMKPRADAAELVQVPTDAMRHRADAQELVAMPVDAAPVALTDAASDRVKLARELIDKAHAALEDGDAETALAMIESSLQMRRSIRGYLERARALQRLNRIDAALDSIQEGLALDGQYAPAWELRGRILWAVRRYDEARVAFEKFLELDPN